MIHFVRGNMKVIRRKPAILQAGFTIYIFLYSNYLLASDYYALLNLICGGTCRGMTSFRGLPFEWHNMTGISTMY